MSNWRAAALRTCGIGQAVPREVDRLLAREAYADVRPAHLKLPAIIPPQSCRFPELAVRMQLTKADVCQLVRHLERLGRLGRLPDPAGGRAAIVHPSILADRGDQ